MVQRHSGGGSGQRRSHPSLPADQADPANPSVRTARQIAKAQQREKLAALKADMEIIAVQRKSSVRTEQRDRQDYEVIAQALFAVADYVQFEFEPLLIKEAANAVYVVIKDLECRGAFQEVVRQLRHELVAVAHGEGDDLSVAQFQGAGQEFVNEAQAVGRRTERLTAQRLRPSKTVKSPRTSDSNLLGSLPATEFGPDHPNIEAILKAMIAESNKRTPSASAFGLCYERMANQSAPLGVRSWRPLRGACSSLENALNRSAPSGVIAESSQSINQRTRAVDQARDRLVAAVTEVQIDLRLIAEPPFSGPKL